MTKYYYHKAIAVAYLLALQAIHNQHNKRESQLDIKRLSRNSDRNNVVMAIFFNWHLSGSL